MSITAIAVFAVFLLGLLLAFVIHPVYALLSYLWIFYNHPPVNWWGTELPDLRYSLIAALVAFITALRLQSPPSFAPWHRNAGAKLIAVYALWMWVQVPWAINIEAHLDGAILFTKYVVLFYLIYKITTSEKRIEAVLWGHVAGCFIFGWMAYTSIVGDRLETIGGPGVDDANVLAAHMITGVAVAGFLFIGLRGYLKWIALLAIPFILNGIILTQSRGGFLALISAAPAAWYLAPKIHRRFVSAAMVLAAILFLTLSHKAFWERTSTIFSPAGKSAEEETRVALIAPQIRMFLDHPLGAGHRGNEFLSPAYIPERYLTEGRRSAHNTFIAALVDQGFPGAILLAGLYFWVGMSLVRLKRLDAQGLPPLLGIYRAAIGTALVSCFVSGLFINLLKTEVQIWFVALLASLITISQKVVDDANTIVRQSADQLSNR